MLVGRLVGAWGVRGWVRVAPFNDPRLSLLLQLPSWWLRPAGATQAGSGTHAVRVEQAKPHGADEIVAKLAGVDDRDAALALDGAEVLLSREQFPEPQPDEVYWADLIGCTVLDPDGEPLGTVVAIEDQPAHPLMRLSDAPPGGDAPASRGAAAAGSAQPMSRRPERRPRERLVPLVPELILSVDLAARVVVADWRRDY